MKVIFIARFLREIEEADKYYFEGNSTIATELNSRIASEVNSIIASPGLYQFFWKNWKQKRCGKFPYLIVYRLTKSSITFVSFFQAQQNPKKKFRGK